MCGSICGISCLLLYNTSVPKSSSLKHVLSHGLWAWGTTVWLSWLLLAQSVTRCKLLARATVSGGWRGTEGQVSKAYTWLLAGDPSIWLLPEAVTRETDGDRQASRHKLQSFTSCTQHWHTVMTATFYWSRQALDTMWERITQGEHNSRQGSPKAILEAG